MFQLVLIHIPHVACLSGRIYKPAEPGHSVFSEAVKGLRRFVKSSVFLAVPVAVTTE